jgi:hypothetical protein
VGVEQTISFAPGTCPQWSLVSELLAEHKFPVGVLMIDGELSFPDETPSSEWRELRVKTPQGMVTIRREEDRLVFVTWGNADQPLRQAWNALTWAFAAASRQPIETANGPINAEDFRKKADLPEVLRQRPGKPNDTSDSAQTP